jgi:hypothetical protein
VLRHLALKPTDGEVLFPSSWTTLHLANPVQIDLTASTPPSTAS